MESKVNLFAGNRDLNFLLEHAVDWPLVVGLRECSFAPDPDRPFETVEEAVAIYRDLLALAGELAGTRILPRAARIDQEGSRFENGRVLLAEGTRQSMRDLSEAGLLGLSVGRQAGGPNIPCVISFAVTELVSYADPSLMNIFSLSEGVGETIEHFGTEDQRRRFIPPLVDGRWTGAMAITEPEAGSDLGRITSLAYEQDGAWRLRGRKRFITNGAGELLLVLARTEAGTEGSTRGLSLMICPSGPQVEVIGSEHKLGIRGSPTCEMVFSDAPCELLGERGDGFKTMLHLMSSARLGVSAQAIGIGQHAFDLALRHARERVQMGVPIVEHPPVAAMLEDMKISLEAQRVLLWRTATAVDIARGAACSRPQAGSPAEDERLRRLGERHAGLARALTPLCKYFCAEESIRLTSLALQVFGGNGYMADYPIERLFRDARVTTIYEGTSEIQVLMCMKDIMGQKLAPLLAEIAAFGRDAGPERPAAVPAASGGEFEYSSEAFMLLADEPARPDPMAAVPARLDRGRELLVDATQYLMGSVMEMGSDEYARLRARDLADLAAYVVVGHELARLAARSEHKAVIAERWVNGRWPAAQLLHGRITSGDRRDLTAREEILAG